MIGRKTAVFRRKTFCHIFSILPNVFHPPTLLLTGLLIPVHFAYYHIPEFKPFIFGHTNPLGFAEGGQKK